MLGQNVDTCSPINQTLLQTAEKHRQCQAVTSIFHHFLLSLNYYGKLQAASPLGMSIIIH
ncbi:unknown protein [Microcystis aeruginosa NIES-843]|jgi:hypothetical protein|uniref:Uncharacterized protein n=1 Tax=Microcystis aeruginosa (strain NIES-843 / IAM M-2473) TaxID=449447 RepID=B0JL78_MICAN|nr:unknown protein [Microcystis aeruginosa NIES-843]